MYSCDHPPWHGRKTSVEERGVCCRGSIHHNGGTVKCLSGAGHEAAEWVVCLCVRGEAVRVGEATKRCPRVPLTTSPHTLWLFRCAGCVWWVMDFRAFSSIFGCIRNGVFLDTRRRACSLQTREGYCLEPQCGEATYRDRQRTRRRSLLQCEITCK